MSQATNITQHPELSRLEIECGYPLVYIKVNHCRHISVQFLPMLNAITQLLGSTNASTTEATVGPPSRLEEDSFGAFSVDEYRPMKVVIIGAGASGIFAAIR